MADTPACQPARDVARAAVQRDPDDNVLRMALEGMIELPEHLFDDPAVRNAAAHIGACEACEAWLDTLYPQRKPLREKAAKYCCASMQAAVNREETRTRFSFEMFRGEDPCWKINDDYAFARYCPWCAAALPDQPFE